MDIRENLQTLGWRLVKSFTTEGQEGTKFPFHDLNLSERAKRYLSSFGAGLYLHQKKAISYYLEGKHVCLTTRTASGKSAVFYAAGIHELDQNPDAKIVAVYPTRALADEQQHRWQSALKTAGLEGRVGRIDGSVPVRQRLSILKESRVLVFTPDILHAWLLSHLHESSVVDFLRSISLFVADEVHTYTGVFGSNAAFLFRRMRHLMLLLDNRPRFIGASATISHPNEHLEKLFGLSFEVVGESDDTSPRYPLEIFLVEPPHKADFLTEIVGLLSQLSALDESRFITFVDSRKQVELLSSILARSKETTQEERRNEGEEPSDGLIAEVLDSIKVLPYRAGYEEEDRRIIQDRLSVGDLKGIISTSGLELGIDIPHLNTCVLIGTPPSATSLHQRIGRVGRTGKGYVIVVNAGDAHSEAVFANPDSFLRRPLSESSLYLENEYLQYVHALCLARLDGEHDQVVADKNAEFTSKVAWPEGFLDLCKKERVGQVPRRLQFMKSEAGDNPNHVYPLRDIESQFKIKHRHGPNEHPLGSLSYSQVMREAYPGAVYYYATQPYRVYKVNVRAREVFVRKEKRYTTQPLKLPTLVFPNLTEENVLHSFAYGKMLVVECNLQIRELIRGIRERRGPNVVDYLYPLSGEMGITFGREYFTRNYFTTGVVITHPVLRVMRSEVRVSLANLLYEVFLFLVPFERQDVNYATDKYRIEVAPYIQKDDPFIAIYDQTYGSLRLTSRLMEEGIIPRLFSEAQSLVEGLDYGETKPELVEVLKVLQRESFSKRQKVQFETHTEESAGARIKVILPGSVGLNLKRGNEQFFVEDVKFTREGLRYRGIPETFVNFNNKAVTFPFVEDIVPIPGVTKMGYYDEMTGEVEPIESTTEIRFVSPERRHRQIEAEKLKFVLNSYFTEPQLQTLSKQIGIDYEALPGNSKTEKVAALVAYCKDKELTRNLLEAAYHLAMEIHGT